MNTAKDKRKEQQACLPAGRGPIVAVLGHIDHGKSTLLDYIRKANVTAGEAGGITQHVSAYEVRHAESTITFLDTPGHEAFQAMRERGAAIADIVILVIAADDGVKAQTLEALKAITESKTPYIVAINKIDKAGASVERAKQTLAEAEVLVEGYGGTIPCVAVSAKTGEGVPELLDMLILVAEMEALKGTVAAPAQGFVLESSLNSKAGPIATLILRDGTIHLGDCVAAGVHSAKVKKLENFLGASVREASCPSPVRVYGFSSVPQAGDEFKTFADKKEAEQYCEEQEGLETQKRGKEARDAKAEEQFELPLALKADTYGTLEAFKREAEKQNTEAVSVRIIHEGVGSITENDIRTASASSRALIIGLNVKIERGAQDLAEKLGITVASFDIIYKMSKWLAEKIAERLPKVTVEEVIGRAKVLKIFSTEKGKQVIGGEVLEGVIKRDLQARLMRRGNDVGRCRIAELQKDRTTVGAVEAGSQFGSLIKCDIAVAPGDELQVVAVVER